MENRLCNSDWCALRRLMRRKKATGRDLRVVKTRKTADGRFLTVLRMSGLIREILPRKADPFEATYEITPEGEIAAEYGFYDGEMKYGIIVATKGWHPGEHE